MRKIASLLSLVIVIGLVSCRKPEVTKPDIDRVCLKYNGDIGAIESVALIGDQVYEVKYRTASSSSSTETVKVGVSHVIVDMPDGRPGWVEQRSNGLLVQREVDLGPRGKQIEWWCLVDSYVHLNRNQKIVDQRQDDSSNGLNDLLWLIPVITSS